MTSDAVSSQEDGERSFLKKLLTMQPAKTISTVVSGSTAIGVKKILKYWHRIPKAFSHVLLARQCRLLQIALSVSVLAWSGGYGLINVVVSLKASSPKTT